MSVSCSAEMIWYRLSRFEVSPVVLSLTRSIMGKLS